MKDKNIEIDEKLYNTIRKAIVSSFFEIIVYLIWFYLLFQITILLWTAFFQFLKPYVT